MAVREASKRLLFIGGLMAFGLPMTPSFGEASPRSKNAVSPVSVASYQPIFGAQLKSSLRSGIAVHYGAMETMGRQKGAKGKRFASVATRTAGTYAVSSSYGGGISCVPFARENSGIEVTGNAVNWWANAAGVYERGSRAEVGSVLNFRSTGRMPLGHVAVVTKVINERVVQVDHANWAGPGSNGPGRVSRGMVVVDVSPDGDWSAVRLDLGDSGAFGNTYPTYGFIYDRPDRGTLVAHATYTPVPDLAQNSRDMRVAAARQAISEPEEVAEAPDDDLAAAPRLSRRPALHRGRAAHAAHTRYRYRSAYYR
jgi:surface antigen